MAKQLSDGRWKCEFCDFTQVKEGWVKNHERVKHGVDNSQDGRKKEKKITTHGVIIKCPCCKGENIRLLSSNNSAEKNAIDYGLKYLCQKCEEVF